MFMGTYNHSVDGKGRFVMPTGFRDLLDGKCVVTKGIDGNSLYIFDIDNWREFVERMRELPNSQKKFRIFREHFIGSAEQIEIDKQGRCLISLDLRDYAEIKTEIKLVGDDNKIILWSAESIKAIKKEEEVLDVADIAAETDLRL